MTSLTIWADEDPPPPNGGQVVLWQAFLPDDAPEGWFSIPDEVHRNRETLRTDYLAWLHEAGMAKVRGRSLVDRMAIRPGLSYWWMTIPADNALESNSPAYVAVRLMALAALADHLGVTNVRVVTPDRSLARLLRDWAKATGRAVEVQLGQRPPWTRENLYRAIPALAALRVIIGHLRIPGITKRASAPSPKTGHSPGITLVDYLAHFSPGAIDEGRFASNYWGPLVELLDELDDQVNWLHISSDLASSHVVERDTRLVTRFDKQAASQSHDLLHRHLTNRVLARVLRDYLTVRWYGFIVRPRSDIFRDERTGASLWKAFRATFRDQFYGRTAMLNCLWLNIFEAAFDGTPPQRLGIYLFENQPWEMAFIHAWRQADHGELLGVAHATTRFWDTRYFKDPRDQWSEAGSNPMPWPDRVAINGPMMRRTCERAHYPAARLIEAEALRYLNIQQVLPTHNSPDQLRMLICGEYSPAADQRMLDLVNESLDITDIPFTATYRPHPAYVGPQVILNPGIRVERSTSLREALLWASVALCGPMSSVSVEAIGTGRATIIVGDGRLFPTSPLEYTGASHVTTAHGLAHALEQASRYLVEPSASLTDAFRIGNELKSWFALLR